MNNIKQHI